MTVVVCLDDHNGMMFNHRRQSSDRVVDQAVLELAIGGRLLVDCYSTKKFPDASVIDGTFNKEDVCFAETTEALMACMPYADRIIIYRWNKVYPADIYFPIELVSPWKIAYTTDMVGYSHDVITQEVYIRE